MQKQKLQELRKRQWVYTNLVFVILLAIFYLLVLLNISSKTMYVLLGVAFLVYPLSTMLAKSPQPLVAFFPGMRELIGYEKDKLQDSWRHYYASSAILFVAFSVFFFIQAIFRPGNAPFMEGIPSWYLIAIPLVLFFIGNMNLRFHNRRIDGKSPEQLKAYALERMLFSIVFAAVVLGMTVIGAIFIWVIT